SSALLLCAAARTAGRRPRAPEQQVSANKWGEVAVEDFLDVAALEFGAVVLDQLVGLKGVGADLAAEADFGLGGVELAELFAALFDLTFVNLRLEQLHGDFAIFVLAALALALDNDSGRAMRDAN